MNGNDNKKESRINENSRLIENQNYIIYVINTSKHVELISKILNKDYRNIKIGKTRNDDSYYLNLMNTSIKGKIMLVSTIRDDSCEYLIKKEKQINIFHLNNDYDRLINHLLKNSNYENKRKWNFFIKKLIRSYKIYWKLRNLRNFT